MPRPSSPTPSFPRPPAHEPERTRWHICPAVGADRAELARLEKASFAGDVISPRSWTRLLDSRSAHIVVARGAGVASPLLGVAVVLERSNNRVSRLYSIAVREEARGQGIAARLLEAAIRDCRGRGATLLRLETRVDNRAAQALFARYGFEPRDRRPAYYEDGTDGLRYQLPLGPLRVTGKTCQPRSHHARTTRDASR
jgi:[ribosomal protein S18]-alanine N-acetyltransferase